MVHPDDTIRPKTFVLICKVRLQLLLAIDVAKLAKVSASGYNINRTATEPNTKCFKRDFFKESLNFIKAES